MIKLQNVEVHYTIENKIKFHNWQLAQGELSLILGASGTGKTTLLNILAGILPPTKGTAIIAGHNPYTLSVTENDRFRGRSIGLIFQKPHLIASLSVLDNLLSAQYFANLPIKRNAVITVLEDLNIAHKKNEKPTKLSQGEQQRVAIARAMLNNPQVILADEPTSALDDENCEAVLNLIIAQAQKHHATLVMATHDQRVKEKISQQLILEKY